MRIYSSRSWVTEAQSREGYLSSEVGERHHAHTASACRVFARTAHSVLGGRERARCYLAECLLDLAFLEASAHHSSASYL